MSETRLTADELRRRTAPGLLAERARGSPDRIAYRAKKLGLYEERSWRDYAAAVGRVALGLKGLGLGPGDRLAIMGDACEEWMWCDLAAQAAGAITYGIYPTASAAEVEYQMRDGGAAVFVAEDQEHVDKILPLLDRLPALRAVIVIDASALFAYRHDRLVRLDAIMADTAADAAMGALGEMAAHLRPEDPAFIVYTSGTTGHPKGAVIAHGRHLAAAATLIDQYPILGQPQRTVVFLPLCHVLGRDVAITLPLIGGLVPHFGADIEDLPTTLFEVAPTVLFTVPRYLQKFAAQILVSLGSTTRLKRAVYELALRHGRRYLRARWNGRTSGLDALVHRVLHWMAFRPLLNKLGFDALRLLVCGGAPMAAETMALWQIYGVNMVEIYGQTETAGAVITSQRGPFPRPGNVGTPPPGWEVRLDATGEILTRSADLFSGYWHQPELTRAVLDEDGWLHTGDIGEWVDGGLRLVDRARDFIVTAGGKTLSPAFIENALRASPYVGEAIVIGHGRKYVTALIEIDGDTVAEWARRQNVAYTGFTSLAGHAAVRALLGEEVAKANAELARVEQIKAFRILPKILDPEAEPVTPTRKVKRTLMLERFRDLVESMYGDEEETLVAAHARGVLDG